MTRYGEMLWQPSTDRVTSCRLSAFTKKLARTYDSPTGDYFALHRWSIDHPDLFWQSVADDLGVIWQTAPTAAWEAPPVGLMRGTRWFPGGRLNFAENLLPKRNCADRVVSLVEGAPRQSLSTADLRAMVACMANRLRTLGVRKGDRVGGVIHNGIEALVAMLGTAAVGGIWSSCSPDFGEGAIVDRLAQVEPKVLFFTTRYQYGGKVFAPIDRLQAIRGRLPSVQTVVLCSPLGDTYPEATGVSFSDFLADAPAGEIAFEPMAFSDPLFIMFSSGTTGVPKCIVHSVGGTLLQLKKEHAYHADTGPDSRLLYFTTCGWMMWNWMVAALAEDACLVLYDGSVAQANPETGKPDMMTLWNTVEQEKLTAFGTSPKFIAACMQAQIKPDAADLSTLKTVFSTGAPLLPEQFSWIYQNVKQDLHLASISGGTDIISCFMLGVPTLPVYAGEIQAAGLGMDIHAWNEDGQDVVGEKGELVCTSPFPSMPVGFWNDESGEKYKKAYFSHYSLGGREVWRHGDYVSFSEHGGVIVYGRSDATLNPGGVRIGTAEIYRQVEMLPQIEDSIAVGERVGGDTDIVLFVKLAAGHTFDADLDKTIRTHIRTALTPRHVPRDIIPVQDIPYTRSGKKVEVAVTQAIHGEPVENLGALVNPASMEEFFAYGRAKQRSHDQK